MLKKPDWPIDQCEKCNYLKYTPISDAFCGKNNRYLWTNNKRLVTKNREVIPVKYMSE